MKKLLIILFVSFVSLSAKAAKHDSEAIAAIVGNRVITTLDVQNRFELVIHSMKENQAKKTNHKVLLAKILQNLIDEQLFIQEAERLKLNITDEDLKTATNNIEHQNNLKPGGLDEYLKSSHLSKEVLLEQLRAQIIWFKVLNYHIRPKTIVTEKEVEETLATILPENMEVTFKQMQFDIPFDWTKIQIENKMHQINNLRGLITSCDDFEKHTKRLDTKLNIDTVTLPIEQLHENLRNMMRVLPIGKASKVIQTDTSLILIVVCKRDYLGLSKNEKEEVREMLMQKKMNLQAKHFLNDLRQKTYVEIKMQLK